MDAFYSIFKIPHSQQDCLATGEGCSLLSQVGVCLKMYMKLKFAVTCSKVHYMHLQVLRIMQK